MDKLVDHSDREHAQYAPSAAARWLACTGSIKLSVGIPEKSSSYAEEGTECHEAAAAVLEGIPFEDATKDLSDEQIWIVQEYTDYCLRLADKLYDKFGDDHKIWVEQRVYSGFSAHYHGTADYVAWARSTAEIVDLKAGFNPVKLLDDYGDINPQLASYAILALDHHDLWDRVRRVRLTIVQPRCYSEPQTLVVPVEELVRFKLKVQLTLSIIEGGDTDLVAGDHCKYCPARGRCPELRSKAVEKSKAVFDEPKAPRLYAPEELEAILDEAEIIEAHINGVRQHVMRELEKGRTFKNYKLVPKRAMSKWLDPEALSTKLWMEYKIPQSETHITKLKTPAQLKKVLKAKNVDMDLSDEFVKESSGMTLARASDPRAATTADIFKDDDA